VTTAAIQAHVLLALAVIIGVARFCACVMTKFHQPRVNGEIVAGVVLGPSVFGIIWPAGVRYVFPTDVRLVLESLAQVSVALFLFIIGVEFRANYIRGCGRRVAFISQTTVFVPMMLGIALGFGLHSRSAGGVDKLGFVLFFGAALAVTAFPVLARILEETGLVSTRIGLISLASAAINDAMAWCLLAIVIALVRSNSLWGAAQTIGLLFAIVAIAFTVVRRVLARMRLVPVWLTILLALLAAYTTSAIGIHPIFGAFIAGLLIPRTAKLQQDIRSSVEPVLLLFLPVFFVIVGLNTRIGVLSSRSEWVALAAIVAVAIAGKVGGSTLAARFVGESWPEAAAIGVLMNTRGLTELIILDVGLQMHVLPPELFTPMVLMALVTTLMATPVLSLLLRGRISDARLPPWAIARSLKAEARGPGIPSQPVITHQIRDANYGDRHRGDPGEGRLGEG